MTRRTGRTNQLMERRGRARARTRARARYSRDSDGSGDFKFSLERVGRCLNVSGFPKKQVCESVSLVTFGVNIARASNRATILSRYNNSNFGTIVNLRYPTLIVRLEIFNRRHYDAIARLVSSLHLSTRYKLCIVLLFNLFKC